MRKLIMINWISADNKMTAKRFYRNQKVKINNPISYKRNGEVATVKWTPEYDSDYVTVVFSDGCSGKYHKNKLLLEW